MTILFDETEAMEGLEPLSVIPGRQRWKVRALDGRPQMAECMQTWLRACPGVVAVRASALTGRLLVRHDPALPTREVAQLIRSAAHLCQQDPPLIPSRATAKPTGTGGLEVKRWLLTALSGGGAALILRGLVHSPLLRLGGVLAATGVIVWQGWRRSRSRQTVTNPNQARSVFRQILGGHRLEFRVASGLSVLGQVLYLTPPLFLGWMLAILTKGPTASLVGIGLTSAASQLWVLAGATLVAFTAYGAVAYMTTMRWRDLAQTVEHQWRTEMYATVQRSEMRYLEGERTTRLAEMLTADIDQFGRVLAGPTNTFLQIGTSCVVLVGAFLFWAPQLAWIAFLPAPLIAWLSFVYQERVAPGHAAGSETRSLLNSQILNSLEASATVKSFVAEDFEIERIRQLSDTYRRTNHGIDSHSMAYNHTVQVLSISALVGVLLFGGLGVLSGAVTLEAYNGLIALPTLLLMRLPELGGAVDQYQRTIPALERVLEVRGLPVESSETGRHLDSAAIEGELALDGVSFAYPGRPRALRDVSVVLPARKTTAIVGVTGAGKTTVAKLLLRLQEVGSGQVLLDGEDVRNLRLQDLRGAIAFVAQDAFLFDGSVGDNIRYGTFGADADQVVRAARLAEADSFIDALPLKYDTLVGERGVSLSGGQRQRLSLARAIIKDAPILILDEATSAVDNETEAAIRRTLVDFSQDRTLIIIAHRLSTIRHADRIYVMGEGGAIVEHGTHGELLGRDGVYASLWRLQVGEPRP